MSVKELKVVLHAAICRPDFCILATTRITIGPILCCLQFRQPGRGQVTGRAGNGERVTGRAELDDYGTKLGILCEFNEQRSKAKEGQIQGPIYRSV